MKMEEMKKRPQKLGNIVILIFLGQSGR